MTLAPRTLPSVAIPKLKIFLPLFKIFGGGCVGPIKSERKFLVLLRRFSLRKKQSYFNIFICSFLHLRSETRHIQFGCIGSNLILLAMPSVCIIPLREITHLKILYQRKKRRTRRSCACIAETRKLSIRPERVRTLRGWPARHADRDLRF